MSTPRNQRSLVPLVLGIGMLIVLVAAALTPNTGALPAQTNCPYGVCPPSSNNNLLWEGVLGGLIVVAGALLAILLLRRRRRAQPAAGPVEPWEGGAGGAAVAAAPAAPGPAPPPGAAYIEGPEDVGQSIPVAPPAAPASPEGAEGDIDSLMKELDKISGEILKRSGPKSPPEGGDEAGADKAE